jgi:hypothetical protein
MHLRLSWKHAKIIFILCCKLRPLDVHKWPNFVTSCPSALISWSNAVTVFISSGQIPHDCNQLPELQSSIIFLLRIQLADLSPANMLAGIHCYIITTINSDTVEERTCEAEVKKSASLIVIPI